MVNTLGSVFKSNESILRVRKGRYIDPIRRVKETDYADILIGF